MKRKIKALVYAIGIGVLTIILYLFVSIKINLFLFAYKPFSYNNEIDSILQYFHSKDASVKDAYKSGDGGSIYFLTYETNLFITIIAADNFYGIPFRNINYKAVSEIKVTENKTYTPILNGPFPLVEQLLNPKESSSLTILIKEPFQIEKRIWGENFYFIRGNFRSVAFSADQVTSILSFRNKTSNEILVLKINGKVYFLILTAPNKSILEMMNTSLFRVN